MRLVPSTLALLAVSAASACHPDVEMYPIGPGTGGTGGTGDTPDAAVSDAPPQGTTISGRVCLIADARTPTACASSGANGLAVALGTSTATTAADGSFTMTAPGGTNLVWRVSGTDVYSAAMQLSAVATIPALSLSLFEEMVTTNNAVAGNGTGSVIARFTMGGGGVSGLVAATSPEPDGQIYYDGISALVWDTTATGTFGVVWVPGLASGSVDVTVGGSHDAQVLGIPIYADTVTFAASVIQ